MPASPACSISSWRRAGGWSCRSLPDEAVLDQFGLGLQPHDATERALTRLGQAEFVAARPQRVVVGEVDRTQPGGARRQVRALDPQVLALDPAQVVDEALQAVRPGGRR